MKQATYSTFSIQEAQAAMRDGDSKGEVTTLLELVRRLRTLDDDLIIYAEANPSWTGDSIAIVGPSDAEAAQLVELKGLPYLIEVSLAKEVLDVWRRWRDGKVPTEEEALAALTYYATNDAYIPV